MRQHISLLFCVVAIFYSAPTLSVEESLDLDTVTEPPTLKANDQKQNFGLMGRIDLTYDKFVEENSELKNQHFLLFLKAKASDKVSFMGEFVSQAFYYVDYSKSSDIKFSFGKIIVPFGDTRYFHHFYGGVQGYGATGVMFKNIWAEAGANANIRLANGNVDVYWVNAMSSASSSTDINFQSSTSERQALGSRYQGQIFKDLNVIGSIYGAEYWPGRPVYLAGLDFYTQYGSFNLKNIRFSMGFANAWIEGSPTGRNYQKRGDYYQVATNVFSYAEWRLRYGSYEDDTRIESQDDLQSLNIGATFPIDVMKLLLEYQLNFEAKDEVDNDTFRGMLSLDF